MIRGVRREAIVPDARRRELLLTTLTEACVKADGQVHAYGLLGDHFHLVEKLGWTEADLATRQKGDRAKVKLAMQLRTETTMTLKWIAARLQMGTGASSSNLLSAQRRRKGYCQYLGLTRSFTFMGRTVRR